MKRYYPGEKQINSEKSHCYNICIACVFLFASCGDKKYNGENTAKYHKITAVEAYALMNEKEVAIVDVRTKANITKDTLKAQKEIEKMDFSHEKDGVIYLAGGCFLGAALLM